MTIDQIKPRLAKIGGAPCGSIPKEELKAASNRLLQHMDFFCGEKFPGGRSSLYGKYWEVPKVNVKIRSEGQVYNLKYNIRISLTHGGFYNWDEPSCRNPIGNPLLLWMIAHDRVLNEKWQFVSKADAQKSI